MKRGLQLGLLLGVMAGVARGDTPESVAAKIKEAAGKVRSVRYKMSSEISTKTAAGKAVDKSVGTLEFLREGDKQLYRMEFREETTTTENGQKTKTARTVLVVSDGSHTYTLSTRDGVSSATKADTDADPLETDLLSRKADRRLLADEKIDGADVYVVEETLKGDFLFKRTCCYYRKDSGICIKREFIDSHGELVGTIRCTDVKVDGRIPADRFEFKPPDGVEIRDFSGEKGKAP